MQVKLGGEKTSQKGKEAALLDDNRKLPFALGHSQSTMEDDHMTCHAVFRSTVYGDTETVDAITAAAAEFLGAPDDDAIQYADPVWLQNGLVLLRFMYRPAAFRYQRGPRTIQ